MITNVRLVLRGRKVVAEEVRDTKFDTLVKMAFFGLGFSAGVLCVLGTLAVGI